VAPILLLLVELRLDQALMSANQPPVIDRDSGAPGRGPEHAKIALGRIVAWKAAGGWIGSMVSLLRAVDAVLLRVPSLEDGVAFYRDQLGHEVIWRTATMLGLRMAADGAELVLSVDTGPETDLLVESVDEAVEFWVRGGGTVLSAPADIPVGRVAVVSDPFGNKLTLVDLSKGTFETDAQANVTGIIPGAQPTD